MNKNRRATLSTIANDTDNLITELEESEEGIKAGTFDWNEFNGKLDDIKRQAEECKDEEQEYFDNMPEGLQGSEKGENAQAAVEAMEGAIDALEEINTSDDNRDSAETIIDQLGTARDGLNDAAGY